MPYTSNSYTPANRTTELWLLGNLNRGQGATGQSIYNGGTYYRPEVSDPYAGMYEEMAAAMERQAAMQADYMAQMSELQQQALLQQEEAAKAANVESGKTAADFTVANADDVARKQMLRRGLMSTYTRYGGQNAQPGAKAAKLGG